MSRSTRAPANQARFVFRVRILSGAIITLAFLLIIRLYFVQIVHGQSYQQQALSQYVQAAPDMEDRGTIFFTERDGTHQSAAVMQTGWRIAINPRLVLDPEAAYAAINAITPVDHDKFVASAAKKDDPYEEVATHVPDDQASAIQAKGLPGVILVADSWRIYPAHTLAAPVIGFTAYQGNVKIGVYGLEKFYENTLAKNSNGLYVNPFAEIFTNVEAVVSTDPASHQGDIITTIEPEVQQELETTLDDVMKTYTPNLAGGIIMDPHTGAIVAMAVRPSFDPNTYNEVINPSIYANPLVSGRYELGSIMKPLTMAAAIDTGVVTTETTYNDTGCLLLSGKKVCNYDGRARHVIPVQEILNQSLNVGATFLEEKIGHSVFGQYVHEYGLGEKTGIDLPNEVSGNIAAIDRGSDIDYASASFGQGIAVSPIEMIRALSTLANDGVLPSPHVVSAIRYDSGFTRSMTFPEGRRVLKSSTVDTVSSMLVTVVDDALVKGADKQEHYSIAAKTGTAQIANPNGGGYYTDRYLHSFFGYFPAHDPKFIIFLYAVEPHGAEFASATLAQPFIDNAKFLINYYEIPPDR